MKQGALEIAVEIQESLQFQLNRRNVDLATQVMLGANKLRIDELIDNLKEIKTYLEILKVIHANRA